MLEMYPMFLLGHVDIYNVYDYMPSVETDPFRPIQIGFGPNSSETLARS